VALVLVRLKLAIQRRSLGRSGLSQRLWFVLTWLLALVLGLGVGALVAASDSARLGQGDLAVVMVLTALFLGWVLIPLIIPVGDQTVDPARLEQYPITARDQVVGLLLGALIAPTALFTFLAAAGGTFASEEVVSARLAVLAASVVFTVMCVAASRALQAALAGALRSRRGRDVVVAGTGVLAVGLYLITQSAHNLTETFLGLESSPLQAVLSWLPGGSIGQGMLAVRDGQWGSAAVHLAVSLVYLALFLAIWAWGIKRRVRGSSGSARKKDAGRASDVELIPPPVNVGPATPMTAAAGQQLRYFFFRAPKATQAVLLSVVMGAVVGHTTASDSIIGAGAVFLVVALVQVTFNVFAFEDTGARWLLQVGAPWRSILGGKLLAAMVILVPALAVFLVVEAIIGDAWSQFVPALLLGLAMAFVGVGLGAMTSVSAPSNLVEPAGGKGRVLISTLLAMVVLGAFVGAGALVWLTAEDSIGQLGSALVIIAAAALVGWLLVRWAGSRLASNPGRLVEALGV